MTALDQLVKEFRPPAFPGSLFLSFEGIEGAGKSTQIVATQKHLEERGFRVLVLREPGGTSFGEKLRQAILDSKTALHPVAEMHLFASSRAQLLAEVTLKELDVPNTAVIYDRYLDSSIAYQGEGGGLGAETILNCHREFPLNLVPHLTFYLEIDLPTSMERQRGRNLPKDYFESQGEEFYRKLLAGYQTARRLFPERIHSLDGGQSPERVTDEICRKIDSFLQEKR